MPVEGTASIDLDRHRQTIEVKACKYKISRKASGGDGMEKTPEMLRPLHLALVLTDQIVMREMAVYVRPVHVRETSRTLLKSKSPGEKIWEMQILDLLLLMLSI